MVIKHTGIAVFSLTDFFDLFLAFLISASLVACRSPIAVSNDSTLDATNGSDYYSQTEGKVFDDAVHEVFMHVQGDTFKKMTDTAAQGGFSCSEEAPYGHVKDFYFHNVKTGAEVKLHNAGVRVKGNTSCDDPIDQRGFKVKLNPVDKVSQTGKRKLRVYEGSGNPLMYPPELVNQIKKQNLFGIEEFGLRRSGNDPSRIRDLVASDVFEFAGALAREKIKNGIMIDGAPKIGGPVYRGSVAYVKIYNGYGVLTEGHMGLVELVDGDLVKSHYGNDALGHLFKIREGKGTFLESDMPQNNLEQLLSYYEPKEIDGKEYDRENPADAKKARDILLDFRKSLSQAATGDKLTQRRKLDALLDVDNILSYMVSANLTGHWDSLVGKMSNNDFLFMNQRTKKWGVLTWDLDNTFGGGDQPKLWMAGIREFDVPLKYRPLFNAVLQNFGDEYKERVKEYLGGYGHLKGIFGYRQMNERITKYRDLITGGADDERFRRVVSFYNHRFANAWCQVYKDESYFAQIANGQPKISSDGLYVDCEKH